MGKMSLWQIEIVEKVSKMNNRELYEYFMDVSQPDDYDGDFTSRGYWIAGYVGQVFEDRLSEWLKG